MKRLAGALVLLSVVLPTGLALRAQEADPDQEKSLTGEKLDDLIQTLKTALAAVEKNPPRKPIRFELRLYDIRDLTYPVPDYPGGSINLVPSGGFGFGFSDMEEFEPVAFYEGDAIADMVRETIAPETWGELRSVGVEFRPPGNLLVRHTPGVHEMIAEMLAELRSRAASQITMRVRLVSIRDAVLRRVLGPDFPVALTDEAEARLKAAVDAGEAEVTYEGSISCTNSQRVALRDWIQETYIQDYDVEIAEGSAIGDPIIQTVREGVVVDVRPFIAGAGDLVIVAVRAEISRLERPIEWVQLPLGRIETPELAVTKLQTTVAMRLGRTMVIGGALSDGDEGALVLLLTPVATRHGGR